MTVAELIERLQQLDPALPVILAKDGEGNGFSPACEVAVDMYVAETTWSGYMVDQGADEDTEEDDEANPVAVIWPTN